MTNTKQTTTKQTWKPNEKQTAFLKALEGTETALTLAEVGEKLGMEFKPGTITPLIAKGLINAEDVTFDCLIVRTDNPEKVVGRTKKTVKAYTLKTAN